MMKRWMAVLIVLVMLITMLPVQLVAAETKTHTDGHICSAQCAGGAVTWTAWTSSNSLPADSGHYYLTGDVTLSTKITVAKGKDITICLGGYDITVKSDATGNPYISGKLTIADCTAYYDAEGKYVSGKITGSVNGDGGLFNVRGSGGVLVLEGGTLTGNNGTNSGGAISLQGSGSGVFYMYGGEITGNSAIKGTALKSGAAIVANDGSKVYLHGGRIYGNTGNENHGQIYAVGTKTVVQVSGNPVVEKIKFGSAGNKNLIVNNLTEGADLTVVTGSATQTIDQVISIAAGGSQTQWSSDWVNINGQPVSMDKGSFVFGIVVVHDHCQDGKTDCGHTQESWTQWTQTDSLPTDGGNWFLATDVTLPATWLVEKEIKLCLNGHKITASNSSARVITAAPGAKLTITDCGTTGTITGGTGILIYRGTASKGGAQVQFYGGCLTGNTQDSTGGVIYLQSAQEGKAGAAFSMYGGEIRDNAGTAIYAASGTTVRLEGGTITQNARGAYIHAQAKATLAGKLVVRGDTGDDLYLSDGVKVQVGTLQEGSAIGVTANGGAFTDACPDYTAYFVSGSPYRKVGYVDGAMHMVAGGEHKHCLCNGKVSGCDHENIAWMAWEKTDSLPTSGCYYLLNDVKMTGELSVSNDLTLCLNGHTVTAASGKRLISTVKDSGATITISDCTGKDTAKLTGGVDAAVEVGGGAVYMRAGSTLKLYAGAITGNKSVTAGGAIMLASNAVFHMYGGEISHNGARDADAFIDGGAIYMSPASEAYIHGGTFRNNTGDHGGAIYACGRTKLYMEDGVFVNNRSKQQGGALYAIIGCDFRISGGSFTGNQATQDGGVLYAYGANTLISGGVFTNNTAISGGAMGFSNKSQSKITDATLLGNTSPNGGAIIVQGKATLELAGGTISENTSSGSAGAIYVNKESNLIMTGGLIEKNSAASMGGALMVQRDASFTMTGGAITGNKTASAGGGIYVSSNGIVTMTGGEITGNTAELNAGGIYLVNATGKLTGGTISKNYGVKDGGGIFSYTSTLEIGGDLKLTGNESKTAGGGVAFSRKSQGKITGSVMIENNKAPNAGGVIVQGESTVEMTGGTVRFNNATTGNAGGLYVHTATFTLKDGKIINNSCHKSLGGGMYTFKGKVTIAGGSISNNQSYMDGAGAYFNKNSTVTISGGAFSNNKVIKGAGAGFGVSGQSQLTMTGGTVSGNTASNAAGVIVQGKAHLKLYGGTIAGNKATNGGGGLYVNRASADLYGGTIKGNTADKNGGGMYIYLSTVTMGKNLLVDGNKAARQAGGAYVNSTTLTLEGTKFTNNHSGMGGGGLWVYLCPEVTLTDIYAKGNTCDATGGGVVITKDTPAVMIGGVIEENQALQGGGLVVQNAATGSFTGVTIRNNKATEQGGGLLTYERSKGMTFEGCEIYGNTAGTNGGGVAMMSLRNAHTPDQHVTMKSMKIYENTAGELGGGLYALKQVWFDGENCDFEKNSAAVSGGGMYIGTGLNVTMTGFKFINNTSGQTGSALYVGDNTVINNLLVTGNKAREGAAVYYVKNNFDGESKQQGNYILCGDVIIQDNEGTTSDLFIDEGTAIATTAEGFGKNTEIHVQLAKGVLTNTILAAYNYEGGDLKYILTYGDRSLREPEYEAPVGPEEETPAPTAPGGDQNTWLYVGIGLVAVIAAAVVLLLLKKKKPEKAAKE